MAAGGGPKRRKKHKRKWVKRNELKRTCESGKIGYAQRGEAQARNPKLNVYRCPDCKEWHLANPIGRKERRRRALEGRPANPP